MSDEKTVKKHSVTDMTVGNPIKLIAFFSFPMLLGNLLQQVYNLTDSFVVGNYTENKVQSLAAMGVSSQVMLAVTAMVLGIIQGAAIVISQIVGAEKEHKTDDRIKRAVDTTYITLLFITIPLTIIGIIISRPLLVAMNIQGLTLDYSHLYLVIVISGMLALYGYTLNSSILQAFGDSKSAFVFLGIFVGLNIGLDLILVVIFNLGVAGVAIATVFSQSAAFVFSIFYINKKDYRFKISFKNLKFDKEIFKAIIKIGIPTSVQETVFSFGMLIVQRLINLQGDNFIAAYGIALKIDRFIFMPLISYGLALMTFTGQNIGANKIERIKKGVKQSVLLTLCTFAVLISAILPFGKNLIGIFNDNKDVIKYGSEYLIRIFPIIFIPGINLLISGVLKGIGKSVIPFIGSEIGLWVGRIPFSYLILFVFTPNIPSNIYHCFTIAWTLELLCNLFYYIKWAGKKSDIGK